MPILEKILELRQPHPLFSYDLRAAFRFGIGRAGLADASGNLEDLSLDPRIHDSGKERGDGF